jgi:PilZ domain
MRSATKERRSSTRQRSFLKGRVFYNNRLSSADCVVRDISEHGAKLTFSGAVTLPDTLELFVPAKEESFRATVQWRFGNEVGISFARAETIQESDPKQSDLAARVQKLEKDVATLTRKLNELHALTRHVQVAE